MAIVQRRSQLVRRSLVALAVGFPLGVVATLATNLFLKAVDVIPDEYSPVDHPFTGFIVNPDFLSFFVAFVAGSAGILSLTNAKSGALIGVLISVTTIPAAANVAVAAAYEDWTSVGGAAGQLAINLGAIVLASVMTLFVQRRYYVARRRRHLSDPVRRSAGLPVGRSARAPARLRRR